MINRQTTSSPNRLNAAAGAILLSAGLLFLLLSVDELAAQVSNGLNSSAGLLDTALAFGLAGLRAVQTYFFDQPSFQAGLHLVLVSFWPLILVIIGAVLLQGAFKGRCAVRGTDSGPSGSEIAHE